MIENSLQFKGQSMMSAVTIDALINKIGDQGFLPTDIKAKTLIQFYKMNLVRVFSQGASGKVSEFSGLNKQHLINFRGELSAFKLYQSINNQ